MAAWLLNRFSEEAKQRVRQGLCVDRGQEVLLHDGPVLVVKCPTAGHECTCAGPCASYTWATRIDLDAGLAALAIEPRPKAHIFLDLGAATLTGVLVLAHLAASKADEQQLPVLARLAPFRPKRVTADQFISACGKSGLRLMAPHTQPQGATGKHPSAKGGRGAESKPADWQGNAEWGIASLLLRCRCCMVRTSSFDLDEALAQIVPQPEAKDQRKRQPISLQAEAACAASTPLLSAPHSCSQRGESTSQGEQMQGSTVPIDEERELALTAEEDHLLAMPSTPPRSEDRRGKVRSRSRTPSLSIWGVPDRLQSVPEERAKVVCPEWNGMQVVCAVPDRSAAEALLEQAARLLPAGMAEAIRFVPSDALSRLSLKAPGIFDAALMRHAEPADSTAPAQDIAAALQAVRSGGRMVYLAGSQVEGAGSAAVSQALEAAPAVAAPLRVHPAQSTRTPTEDPTLRSQLLCADRLGVKRRDVSWPGWWPLRIALGSWHAGLGAAVAFAAH